jgi:alpha-L-rhamnosidase
MQVQAQVQVSGLRCEQLSGPQGIDVRKPRLSWQITGSGRNIMQTAYQVMVASSAEGLLQGKADCWNSGKVISDQSILVNYGGEELQSRASCYWKVKVWTTAGESDWSTPATWSMGLLDSADWKARWIGYEQGSPWDSVSKFSRLSARYFRRAFQARRAVRRATIYIAGPGHYELYVNGAAIGDQVLAQAPTDYTKRVLYNTFDVTKECRKGGNVLGVVLGNGRFFTMRPKYKPNKIKEFGFPKLLLQLEMEYEDGKRERVVSDEHWKFTADGPIRSNNEYDGEEYDATKELAGWNVAGYDDGRWLKPQLVGAPGGDVRAQVNEPIRVMTVVRPLSVRKLSAGGWILDMGQNMAGWVEMRVKGARGQKVVLRYGETLEKDGTLYTANLRDARATDSYILKGVGEEHWHPVFVFHGFRYVEINGFPGTPAVGDFEGKMVYDDLRNTGTFETDHPLLDQIYKNAWWSIAANYKGMPLDCPQRNERMPWLGDRATGSLGESYMFGNGAFYAKWLNDIEDAQKPDGALPDVAPAYWNYYSDDLTWPATYLLVADMLYRQFGDIEPMRRHYASMKQWLQYMGGKYVAGGIMTKDKYGDWCVPPESPELIHSRDSSRSTDGQLIATAYYYRLLVLMEGFAKLLHREDDWGRQAGEVKKAFNRRWYHTAEGMYANNTVTANLLPLYFGMTSDPARVFHHIVSRIEKDDQGHISTGVIGTQWLMRGLTKYGRPDLAWKIATNEDYPGWGYMVRQGATTIWELWNGDAANPAMNSHNHVMLLGDLITWMYEDIAGISPGAAGFRTLVMRPAVRAAGRVAATYQTPYGMVKSSWKKEDGKFYWDIAVPGNTKATVYLPDGSVEEVGSGEYHFEAGTDSGFIYEQAPFPECHAATIAETPGGLVTAWFGGTKERNPDVCIYVSRKGKGQHGWTIPVNVANGILNDTLRYACWNPVLYQIPGGELLLFYKIGPSPSQWKGWLIRSRDGGITWSAPKALPEGFLGPVKNKPVLLDDGVLICPVSTEGHGWKVHFELTADGGETWKMSQAPGGTLQAIQPSILFHKDGSLQVLCRSQNRAILESWSKDKGRTWSPLTPTSLPNNNSGTDAVTLADGRQLLVYNHVLPPPGKSKGQRSPLNVAISPDGKEWYAAVVLENDTLGQYSYPSVIQSSDGMVHIVYTWRRKKIKYVTLDPSKLKLEKIIDGVWPATVTK